MRADQDTGEEIQVRDLSKLMRMECYNKGGEMSERERVY